MAKLRPRLAGEVDPGRLAQSLAGTAHGRRPAARHLALGGLLGLLGSTLVLAGGATTDSPYTLGQPGAWFFGVPTHAVRYPGPPPSGLPALLAVLAVLGGVALLAAAFVWLVRLQQRTGRLTPAQVGLLAAAWALPLLAVAPLFSRDVYTYVAQGQMMALHLDPYRHGPAVLGAADPFARLTDPLWRSSVSPYGPLFLLLDEGVVMVSGHSVLASVEMLRLLFLAGVWLAAWSAGLIARRLGRDPVLAVLLVACNPLVLVHLVAGAHDDAIMLGLLLAGLAAATCGRPGLGVACCALGAAVKAPALLGCAYIGFSCLAPRAANLWRRAAGALAASLAGVAALAAVGWASGLGMGWVRGLSNAGVVRLWLSPSTGIGMALGDLLRGLGLIHGRLPWLRTITVTRGLGLAAAAAVCLAVFAVAGRDGPVRATGWALLGVAVLGSALWPWYLTWGLVALAPVASRRERGLVVAASVAACYLGVPVGSVLAGILEPAGGTTIAAGAALVTAAALAAAAALRVALASTRTPLPAPSRALAQR